MNTKERFFKFVFPSMISSFILGTFTIIDGLFIGQKVGDLGLAAINYAYPVTAFIQSVGFGIGISGAVLISIAQGKKENDKKYIFNTYVCLLISIIIMMPIFLLAENNLLTLFGASKETLILAKEYYRNIIFATSMQVLSQGLIPIIRNHSKNNTVMIGLILGFVSNLILDYIFIYPLNMGLKGAAIATNLSQTITTIFCIIVLCQKEFRCKFVFDIKIIKKIFIGSFSPFGVSYSSNIVLIIINKAASFYSDALVAAYTATSYVTYIVQKLIQGVADGVQPLLSYSYGENNKKDTKTFLKYSLILSFAISLISLFITILFRNNISKGYGLSNTAQNYYSYLIIFFSISFLFQAVMRIYMSFFYSIKKDIYSMIIVYGEPIIDLIIVLICPRFINEYGIYITMPVSNFILMITSILLYKKSNKSLSK